MLLINDYDPKLLKLYNVFNYGMCTYQGSLIFPPKAVLRFVFDSAFVEPVSSFDRNRKI